MADKTARPKRKAADLELPPAGEDAAERKRVLNVLAQRRYRQRRREHLQILETQVSSRTGGKGAIVSDPSSQHGTPGDEANTSEPDAAPEPLVLEASEYFAQASFSMDPSYATTTASATGDLGPSLLSPHDLFATDNAAFMTLPLDDKCLWEPAPMLPSLPSTPLSTSSHPSYSSSSSSLDGSAWPQSCLPVRGGVLSDASQPSHVTTQAVSSRDVPYSFPDEAYLEMSELRLLSGCMSIARRMNVDEIIWSLTAVSPFCDPAMMLADFSHLPSNLHPTVTQLTMPHHPLIDLLPWPSVRDKMIMILMQPPEHRPPGAASPMALLNFVYDIEDTAEGVRISGADPSSERNWEVGEKVFKSWWWMFDRDIIRRSNELRLSRGAPLLGSGTILGEAS